MPLPHAARTIFVYEYLTGGGLYSEGAASLPVSSLLAEGAAMVRALTADFACIKGCHVHALCDVRQRELKLGNCEVHLVHNEVDEMQAFQEWSARSDWTVVIAPETGCALSQRVEIVERAGGRLLGPGSEWVHIASHKTETTRRLASAGVATPRSVGTLDEAIYPDDYPLIIKPVDGAGSLGLRRLERPPSDLSKRVCPELWHIEQWIPGWPASVLLLCRDDEVIVLPAGQQRFSHGAHGTYLGGRMPLCQPWRGRAEKLAEQAIRALPGAQGFVGVDVILGEAEDGSRDVVLEVNPRLTTSYVGLRKLLGQNLPELMLSLAEGGVGDLELSEQVVEFDANGSVRCLSGTSTVPM